MNYSDLALLALAAIPILYRGWLGCRYGASFEVRQLLMIFFGMLVAIRYWQPCTERLVDSLTFDPRWVAIGAFVVLFAVASVVAGVVVNAKAQIFQGVQRNYLDNLLGLVAGAFSGALLGACLIWLSTVAVPGKFQSMNYAQSFLRFPRDIVRAIETEVDMAPGSIARTRYPVATIIEVPVDPSDANVPVPEGSVLMRRRGQIVWE